MKINIKQQVVIDTVKDQLSFWQNTNDISSPTHYSHIDAECMNIEEEIGEENAVKLAQALSEIYTIIKKLK